MNTHRHTYVPLLRIGLVALFLMMAAAPTAQGQAIAKKTDPVGLKEALKAMLQDEGAAKLRKVTVSVDAAQAKQLAKEHGVQEAGGSYTVYHGVNAEDNVIGSVVVVNEQGKEGPLQMVVAMRPDGKVYDLGFTVFGEDRGKSALTWAYLKQYVGKTSKTGFKMGKDIDGITGATWTSTSVANAVHKGVVVYDVFVVQAKDTE